MKRIISVLLSLSFVLAAALSLTACGEPKDLGAEISVYLGEDVYDFDPTDYYADSNAAQFMSLLYEPLFTLNENGKLKKDGVAKKYKVDEDERTIKIELRETYWSDGIRVTADDFVFAWRNLLDPSNANPAAALLYDIENAAQIKAGDVNLYDLGANTTGTYEITIRYREGADYKQLLKNLAAIETSPLRQSVYETAEGYWSKHATKIVTNGPFMVANISHEDDNKSLTLIRNEGYHQELNLKDPTDIVRPSKLISFTAIGEGEKALSYKDIEEKTVFYMGDASLADRKEYKKKAETSDLLSTYTYVFNTEKPLFAIPEVRQALSLAIDREAIIDEITFGKAATGFLPDTVKNYKGKDFGKTLISKNAKLDEAKALIAGITLPTKEITLAVNNDEESLAIANIAKAAWEELGFTVTIEALGIVKSTVKTDGGSMDFYDSELQLLVKKAARGERDFDVVGIDWNMYSSDPFVALAAFSTEFSGCGISLPTHDTSFGSFGGYADEAYDALIKSAYETKDQKERDKILADAEKMLVDSAAVVPLVFNQSFYFKSKDISKIDINGFGQFVLTDMKQKNYEKYLVD